MIGIVIMQLYFMAISLLNFLFRRNFLRSLVDNKNDVAFGLNCASYHREV